MGDVFSIFLLSLLAMFNPTLLAAVTIMMLLPEPRRLIAGYLARGLAGEHRRRPGDRLLPARLPGVESSKKTLSPLEDLVFGAILVIVGWALLYGTGGDRSKSAGGCARRQKHGPEEQKESLPERLLGRGSIRVTFAVGALLSLPGRLLHRRPRQDREARLADRSPPPSPSSSSA